MESEPTSKAALQGSLLGKTRMCSRENCKKMGVFSLNRSLKEKGHKHHIFLPCVFFSLLRHILFFSDKLGEKKGDELKIRLEEEKENVFVV